MGLIENIKSFSDKENLSVEKNGLLQSFLAKGFPTIKQEDWKYTSLKKIVADNFSVEGNGVAISESDIKKFTLGLQYKIVFCGGNLISKPSIDGVRISAFSEFEAQNKDAISVLNSSLAKKGFTIKIAKNTVVENNSKNNVGKLL